MRAWSAGGGVRGGRGSNNLGAQWCFEARRKKESDGENRPWRQGCGEAQRSGVRLRIGGPESAAA